jgi:hypothetical protein
MKKDLVKHYLLKYPDYPKRTLAKLIVEENPDIGTINSVRNLILLSTGSMGETHKNKAIMHTKSTIQEGLEKLKVVSHNKEMQNVHLGQGRYLVLSDVHIPYHDEDALTTALEWGLNNDVDTIILNGDIMDCYPVSSFVKGPVNAHVKRGNRNDKKRFFLICVSYSPLFLFILKSETTKSGCALIYCAMLKSLATLTI